MKRFTALAIMMAMLMGVLPAAALAADGRGDPVTWKIGHDWETGKAGYVDQNGDWAIEPRYDQAWEFDETGHAIVEMRGDTYSGYRSGIIDATGAYTAGPIYQNIWTGYGRGADLPGGGRVLRHHGG